MVRAKANRRKAPRRELPKLTLPRPRVRLNAVLAPAFAAALVYGAWLAVDPVLDQPVAELTIQAPFQRVSALAIEQAAAPELERGFLSVDLEALRRRVEALDWVDRAIVSRVWPDRLVVSVREHRAAARWGESGLLNVRGELFTSNARHAYPELPQLDGPPGSETDVARIYLEVRGRLAAARFDLGSLSMDARGAVSLDIEDGPSVRLGRDEIDARLDRFFDVVAPSLADSMSRVDYVDLRYTNGFAVGWVGGEPVTRFASSGEDGPRA